jgi:hypothetical protein
MAELSMQCFPALPHWLQGWMFEEGEISMADFLVHFWLRRRAPPSPLFNAGHWDNMASWYPLRCHWTSALDGAESRRAGQSCFGWCCNVLLQRLSSCCFAVPLTVEIWRCLCRADPNVLWLHYEDLQEDLPAAVRLIAQFIGIGADDAGGWPGWKAVVSPSSRLCWGRLALSMDRTCLEL